VIRDANTSQKVISSTAPNQEIRQFQVYVAKAGTRDAKAYKFQAIWTVKKILPLLFPIFPTKNAKASSFYFIKKIFV